MKILGVQTGHDPSVCLFENQKLIFYNEEKKVTQDKHYNFFPFKSLLNSLKHFNKKLDYCFLTSYTFVEEELQFLRGYLKHLNIQITNEPFSLYGAHHLSHAFKAFVDSKFENARVFVVDGRGSDWFLENKSSTYETCSIYDLSYDNAKCIFKKLYTHDVKNEKYKPDLMYHPNINKGHLAKIPLTITDKTVFDVSHYLDLGHFYKKVSKHYGFENEEGKFMGFQSYGTPEPIQKEFTAKEVLNLDKQSTNQASACQELFENKYKNLVQKYKHPNMVFTGGTALNVVNNYKLHKAFPKCNLWFDPLCGDGGNSIGIVYAINILAKKKIHHLDNIYIGNRIDNLNYSFRDNEQLKGVGLKEVVELLAQGNVVGLIQGKAEAGPRALGNRSLLLDPTLKKAKDTMNDIKKREHFRPFACSILEEKADTYFDMAGIKSTPYMMHAPQAKPLAQHSISSLIHVDNTCRIQTINKKDNNTLHEILNMFHVPVLMNTSFNLAGYPIVDSLDDIMNTVRSSDLKYVYFADFNKLLTKN